MCLKFQVILRNLIHQIISLFEGLVSAKRGTDTEGLVQGFQRGAGSFDHTRGDSYRHASDDEKRHKSGLRYFSGSLISRT